jgi:hypothetical protein
MATEAVGGHGADHQIPFAHCKQAVTLCLAFSRFATRLMWIFVLLPLITKPSLRQQARNAIEKLVHAFHFTGGRIFVWNLRHRHSLL